MVMLSAGNRVVKQSSDLRTLNFKFEFVFIFQPFAIRIQASLIRRRRFCLESGLKVERCYFIGALCDNFFVNCQPSIQVTLAVCLLTPPLSFLHTTAMFNYSPSCTAPLAVVYWCKLSKWQILVAQTQSRHQSRHGLTSWLIVLLIDCFPACGVRTVTLILPHSADIKRKLL